MALEEQRPDAHSRNAPLPGTPIDPAQVQVAIGEKVERLLGTVARWHGVVQPDSRATVLTADGKFDPQLAAHLAKRLNLTLADDESRGVLDQLGGELRAWVRDQPDEARRRGLELAPDGSVTLLCRALKPVLPPLEKKAVVTTPTKPL
jgi:hypothetical protein